MSGTKNIQLPTGEVVSFPDTMGDDAISSAIQRNFPQSDQLSPEVEALRQRNMASAMRAGGSPIAQAAQGGKDTQSAIDASDMHPLLKALLHVGVDPFAGAIEGANQAFHGNWLGGGAGIANANFQSAFQPVSAINEAVKQIPYVGQQISDIAGAIPKGLGAVGEFALSPLGGVIPQSWKGNTPEQQQYTAEQGKQIAQLLGQVGIGEAIPPLARKLGIPTSGAELEQRGLSKSEANFNEAIKPKKAQVDRMDVLRRAEPYIKQIEKETPIADRPTSGNDAMSATRKLYSMLQDAGNRIDEKVQDQADRHGAVPISIDDVAAKIRAQITPNMARFAPKQAADIEGLAQRYSGQVPLRQVYDEVQRLNQETKPYENATPNKQLEMRQQDPTLNAQVTGRDALRDVMFDNLETMGEKDAPELRKDYGAVAQLRNDVYGKITQAEAQLGKGSIFGKAWSPMSAALAGEVALKLAKGAPGPLAVGGAVGLLRKMFLERQKIDPTLERSITKMGKSKAIPEPRDITPNPPASGATPEAPNPISTPAGGSPSPVREGTEDVPAHRKFVESNGATYLGTTSDGRMWYDDKWGGTNGIPKGTPPDQAKRIIAKSNATPKVTPKF